MNTIEKTNLLYELMLVANDDAANVRQSRYDIARVFEDATGQDIPENGYMVDEMANTGIVGADKEKLIAMVKKYWTDRG